MSRGAECRKAGRTCWGICDSDAGLAGIGVEIREVQRRPLFSQNWRRQFFRSSLRALNAGPEAGLFLSGPHSAWLSLLSLLLVGQHHPGFGSG